MTHKQAITIIMGILIKGYGKRFEFNEDGSTAMFWEGILEGFEPNILIQAVTHAVSISTSQWPPTPGEVRDIALSFKYGELMPQSPEQAWRNVCDYATDKISVINELEKATLKQVGGSWAVRHADNQQVIMAQFVKAFRQLQERQRIDRVTLPSVKRLVEKKAKELPDKNIKQLISGVADKMGLKKEQNDEKR